MLKTIQFSVLFELFELRVIKSHFMGIVEVALLMRQARQVFWCGEIDGGVLNLPNKILTDVLKRCKLARSNCNGFTTN